MPLGLCATLIVRSAAAASSSAAWSGQRRGSAAWRGAWGHPACPVGVRQRLLLPSVTFALVGPECARKDFGSSGAKWLELVQMRRLTASSQHARFLPLALLVPTLLSRSSLSLAAPLTERCQEQLGFLRLCFSRVSAVCLWHGCWGERSRAEP